ncbi:glycosyltransferase family 4 protein [Synechococcus sp. MW101C3]|uniref:glycosyltransferase family 4 protein n=1 Tax=Synechococcus sp. MW101C3 TaxID=210768 RepID=UPI000B97E4AE|nr:glycosyltransferase family 4 protein [Synechococcus sp. MW101C3]
MDRQSGSIPGVHALAHLRQRARWRRNRSRAARVTVVNQFFPPDYAATGQLLADLTGRLSASGLQIQILTGMPAYAGPATEAERIEFEPNRCIRRTRVSRFWPRRIRGRAVNSVIFCMRSGLRLLRYVRRGDLIVYTSEPPYLPIVGWLVHQVTRTPYLLIVYDLYPDVLEELRVLPASHWLCRLWRGLHRPALTGAAEVVVLSELMAERVLAQAPGIAERLHVIPSWADPELIRPLPKDANWFVQRYRLEDCFTVLYSGNQGRCHDLVTLLGAALILRGNQAVRFLIVGDGPQHRRLLQLAHEWDLGNVCFLPYQDLEALPQSLAAADLAVVSVSIEAVGVVAPCKLYGHLAAATPIAAITPSGSELRRLVESSGCGRWFANGDAVSLAAWIQDLVVDPDAALAHGAAGLELLRRTATPELVSERYRQLICRHLPNGRAVATLSSRMDVEATKPQAINPKAANALQDVC